MAQFKGTVDDFINFIGPFCRNKVNSITRNEKLKHNKTCQFCKKNNVILESAHLLGFERNKIIRDLLDAHFKVDDEQYHVELNKFEQLFIDRHLPINEHFYFLCSQCHRDYDSSVRGERRFQNQTKSLNSLKEEYKEWLEKNGYRNNTINSYCHGIERICEEESYESWEGVIGNIGMLLGSYGQYGVKSEIGAIGHNTVISALRRFNEFLKHKY